MDTTEIPIPNDQTPNGHLTALSAAELRQLIADADAALLAKKENAKKSLLPKWKAEAAEAGLTFEDVLGATHPPEKARRRRSDAGAKPDPQYRDPETGKTWSGKGRAPAWMVGKDRDELRIA